MAWDNHRWTRYRTLIGAMPTFLSGFAKGRAAFQLNPAEQTSYRLTKAERELAEKLFGKLDEAATIAAAADPDAIENLETTPRPRAVVRRVPQI
jgi:hypothetical protein